MKKRRRIYHRYHNWPAKPNIFIILKYYRYLPTPVMEDVETREKGPESLRLPKAELHIYSRSPDSYFCTGTCVQYTFLSYLKYCNFGGDLFISLDDILILTNIIEEYYSQYSLVCLNRI